MRRVRLVASFAGLTALIAGCAAMPTSGRVVEHSDIDMDTRVVPRVGGVAQGPTEGADPASIVDGFIEAMRFYQPNYETAREFLTPEASRQWDPDSAVMVYNADPRIAEIDIDRFTLELAVGARLDEDRTYTQAGAADIEEFTIDLEEADGEWRITDPPAGLIISDADFEGEFGAFDLFFYDPEFTVLVPDPVFLPTQGPVATMLAQKLLGGPSSWLGPGVRTAFPQQTELAVDAVVVSGGVAEVRLTEDALEADERQRRRMVDQLAWTYGSVPNISSVVVLGGQTLIGEGRVQRFPDSDPAQVRSSSLFAATDDGVVRLARDGTPSPVPGPLGVTPSIADIAVNPQMTEAVVIDESRETLSWSRLWSEAEPRVIVEGESLRSPSFDRTGAVWVLDGEGSATTLRVIWPAAEVVVEVDVPGVDAAPVDAVAVSVDGTRVALVAAGQPYQGVVVRGFGPGRLQVVGVRPIAATQVDGRAIDVAWDQYNRLAVLTSPREDDPSGATVYVVRLDDQSATTAGVAPDAESIVANWREPSELAAGTPEMMLVHQARTLGWLPVEGILHPAYPG